MLLFITSISIFHFTTWFAKGEHLRVSERWTDVGENCGQITQPWCWVNSVQKDVSVSLIIHQMTQNSKLKAEMILGGKKVRKFIKNVHKT